MEAFIQSDDAGYIGTGLLCLLNFLPIIRDRPIMLIFYLLCYAAVLKILTYYAQYYAHVKTVLLEYIHLYHKIFNMVTVLLKYI